MPGVEFVATVVETLALLREVFVLLEGFLVDMGVLFEGFVYFVKFADKLRFGQYGSDREIERLTFSVFHRVNL